MNFEVYSFATFFEPNIAQITEYNGFLQEALTTMANFQVTHALLNKDEAAKPKGRVLQTTDEPKKKPRSFPIISEKTGTQLNPLVCLFSLLSTYDPLR